MTDPDQMLAILTEMQDAPDGRMLVDTTVCGESPTTRKKRHQIELLEDAGLAQWESDAMVRITNEGYEFLRAIDQGHNYREMFGELVDKGRTVADAGTSVVAAVRELQ